MKSTAIIAFASVGFLSLQALAQENGTTVRRGDRVAGPGAKVFRPPTQDDAGVGV